jgi:flagellar hook-associated protein 2
MDIPSIAGNRTHDSFLTQPAQQVVSGGTADSTKLADDRKELPSASTKVQLSPNGQARSALAGIRAAAQAVTEVKKTATAHDIKVAANNFATAYNKAVKAINSVAESGGQPPGAISTTAGVVSHSAPTAGVLSSPPTNIGIAQNRDGTLTVDTRTLDRALQSNPAQVRASLTTFALQASQSADQLANNASAGDSGNSALLRNRVLQNEQPDQVAASQRDAIQQISSANNVSSFGVAAYQKTFTR